jgi:hypothetical protein
VNRLAVNQKIQLRRTIARFDVDRITDQDAQRFKNMPAKEAQVLNDKFRRSVVDAVTDCGIGPDHFLKREVLCQISHRISLPFFGLALAVSQDGFDPRRLFVQRIDSFALQAHDGTYPNRLGNNNRKRLPARPTAGCNPQYFLAHVPR